MPNYLSPAQYKAATQVATVEELIASREDREYTDRVNRQLTVASYEAAGKSAEYALRAYSPATKEAIDLAVRNRTSFGLLRPR